MVDSSKWEILEEGLKHLQGKGIVNSISLKEGELEIGQVSALIDEVLPVKTVFNNLLQEFEAAKIPSF